MKNNKEHRELFGPGGCLTKKAIELFIDDVLLDAEKKRVLQHSKKCLICADAIEGSSLFNSSLSFSGGVSRMQGSKWRNSLEPNRKKHFSGISAIAASILVLLGVFYIFQFSKVLNKRAYLADNKEAAIVVEKMESQAVIAPKEVQKQRGEVNKPPMPVCKNIHIARHEIDLNDEYDFCFDPIVPVDIQAFSVLESDELDCEYYKPQEQGLGYRCNSKCADNEKNCIEKKRTNRKIKLFRTNKQVNKGLYVMAKVSPMFQGGSVDNFNKFLAANLSEILPDSVLNQTIVVGFKVDTAGNINNVTLISGTSSKILNKEIVQLVKESPVLLPSQNNGQFTTAEQQLQLVINKK